MACRMPQFYPMTRTTIALWGGFFSWVIFVCFLSSLSASKLASAPHFFKGFDKVVHYSLFFPGSILLTMAVRGTMPWAWGKVLFASVLSLALFGWGDEIHQLFTPGRSGADFGDWLADFCGALTGAVLVFLLSRYRSRRQLASTSDSVSPDLRR